MVILTEGKKHIIIKRDGREEPYNEEKLRKVTSWAAGGKTAFVDKLLKDLNIKIDILNAKLIELELDNKLIIENSYVRIK